MEKYIKPCCEIIIMDTNNCLLAASGPGMKGETGDGVWHAPKRRDFYEEEDEFEENF